MTADPTDLDLAELRRAADGATPGPWSSGVIWGVVHYRRANFDCADIADVRQSPHPVPNALHIAAWSPSVALRLLARLERAEVIVGAVASMRPDDEETIWHLKVDMPDGTTKYVHEAALDAWREARKP